MWKSNENICVPNTTNKSVQPCGSEIWRQIIIITSKLRFFIFLCTEIEVLKLYDKIAKVRLAERTNQILANQGHPVTQWFHLLAVREIGGWIWVNRCIFFIISLSYIARVLRLFSVQRNLPYVGET